MAEEHSGFATLRDIGPLREDIGGLKQGHEALTRKTERMEEEARTSERELHRRLDSMEGRLRAEVKQDIRDLGDRITGSIGALTTHVQSVSTIAQAAATQTTVLNERTTTAPDPKPAAAFSMPSLQPVIATVSNVGRVIIVIIVVMLAGEKGAPIIKGLIGW